MFFVFPDTVVSVSVGAHEFKADPESGGCDIPAHPKDVAPFGLVPGEPKLPLRKKPEPKPDPKPDPA